MSTGCDVGIMTNVCFLSQKIVRNEKRVKLTQNRTGQNNFIKITLRSYFPFSNTQVQETQNYIQPQKRITNYLSKKASDRILNVLLIYNANSRT